MDDMTLTRATEAQGRKRGPVVGRVAGRDQDRLVVGSSLPDSFVTLVDESRACDITVLPTALTFNPVGAGGSTTAAPTMC